MKFIWKALLPVLLHLLFMNHATSPGPCSHLQTALIVFISHCVVAGSAHCLSAHGSEICMQWVFQHASHISSFRVSQAHFVPANPTHQSAVPHSQVTHRCLCPLLPVPDLKGRGETPHLSDKISAHWLGLSAHNFSHCFVFSPDFIITRFSPSPAEVTPP